MEKYCKEFEEKIKDVKEGIIVLEDLKNEAKMVSGVSEIAKTRAKVTEISGLLASKLNYLKYYKMLFELVEKGLMEVLEEDGAVKVKVIGTGFVGFMEILNGSDLLKGITSLNLRYNKIGDEGAKAIASSPYLTKLTSLDLDDNKLGAEGAKAIASSPYLTNLTSLDLSANEIGAEGAKAIASSPNLTKLTSLDLFDNNIGYEGAKAIENSPYLIKLKDFSLY